jgi:alpha-tubulin suppressor-like RCC1 family protein
MGKNDRGQLGNGTNINSNIPVPISLNNKCIVAIAAGEFHSLALNSSGNVYSWGGNNRGQLGNGTNTNSNVPIKVQGLLTGKRIVAIAAGAFHSLALDSNMNVYSWGLNTDGQLGDGTNIPSNVPVSVTGALANKRIRAIAGGGDHSLSS